MGPKKRILVVDDEPDFTHLLKLNLEQTGAYEVRVEHRGAQALATARVFQPHLILLDVIMPDMDGGEAASQLKADPALKDVPVVFLTAVVSRDETAERQGVIGGCPFIAKPVGSAEVVACIEEHLLK